MNLKFYFHELQRYKHFHYIHIYLNKLLFQWLLFMVFNHTKAIFKKLSACPWLFSAR